MKDLGVLNYFLGIEIARRLDGLFLSHCKYAFHIISEVGMLGSIFVSFPRNKINN
uniref:Reverse transcriptase Ty1/copia-type domain-containing protein n=1 Tax=Cajanus cajan TaxID=3821 RepID=A0A151T4A1_CAJCA|nr:hypothetical protein KK1_016395 [Cajanus cajan]